MHILVTGGAGFIGSHLCERLLKQGNVVQCLDNLITGSEANLSGFRSERNFSFIRHDVSRPITPAGAVDAVLHFASPASPEDYMKYPIQTLKVGSLGTLNALGVAKAHGAKFLLASTSEVYGDPEVHPQPETYWGHVNPVGPRGVYDEAKRFAEAMTMAYQRYHRLNTGIVRIFNCYGPRMRINDGRAIPNFITQALRGEPITVYGDGSQTRSFCYVDDLVDGICRYLQVDHPGPVNLGNPEEFTIRRLAETVIEVAGSASSVTERPLPKDDPKRRSPDIGLAVKLLGWQPKIPLREGLERTVAWVRERAA